MRPGFLFSGTLGDAYIALCKVEAFARDSPCTLRRLSRHGGIDPTVAQLAALFENVEYIPDFVAFESIDEMRHYAFAHADRFVNIFWDGDGRGNEPNDPPALRFTRYPELDLVGCVLTTRKRHVGIQLHSGCRPANHRRLEVEWIRDFCRIVADSAVGVVIMGTGEGYEGDELACLHGMGPHVLSLVGETSFQEWLGILANVDYLITPEGFACFFALSQRTPSLVLFEDTQALLRMPPEWRANATCVRPVQVIHKGTMRWIPLPSSQAASLVLARLDPEAA